jgi:hypothetical protein
MGLGRMMRLTVSHSLSMSIGGGEELTDSRFD